ASGEAKEGPDLVMPLLQGGTLRARLQKGRLSIEESLRVALRLSRALARAHVLGVVHRDLKPENVIFTDEGDPLVADLGVAKHWDGGTSGSVSLSSTGELRGTAGYAPVEQLNDAKAAVPASDVFALGAILYECLAGRPAFLAPSLVALLAKVEDGEHEPLEALRPETPPWLVAIVERALATEKSARY